MIKAIPGLLMELKMLRFGLSKVYSPVNDKIPRLDYYRVIVSSEIFHD